MSLHTNISFSDQKYHGKIQNYMLMVHSYLCLTASYLIIPLVRAQDS